MGVAWQAHTPTLPRSPQNAQTSAEVQASARKIGREVCPEASSSPRRVTPPSPKIGHHFSVEQARYKSPFDMFHTSR